MTKREPGHFAGSDKDWMSAKNAPDLLLALKDCLAWIENMDGTKILLSMGNPDATRIVLAARAAIAKAEGR